MNGIDHDTATLNEPEIFAVQILAVILARAGSAGLPGKHHKPLFGRPLIRYTFDHARAASSLTRIVVSTDCPHITQMAANDCIETIQRPAVLATSDASVQAAMLHAMKTVESRSGFRADGFVVLYGNVPVRGEGVIDRAVDLLTRSGCDSVRTLCPVGKWHPTWMLKMDGDRASSLTPNSVHRRQDLEPVFMHDGAVVAVSRASLLRGEENPDDAHAFFGVDRRAIKTGIGETVEVDHLRDLYWAEAVLRERMSQGQDGMRLAS